MASPHHATKGETNWRMCTPAGRGRRLLADAHGHGTAHQAAAVGGLPRLQTGPTKPLYTCPAADGSIVVAGSLGLLLSRRLAQPWRQRHQHPRLRGASQPVAAMQTPIVAGWWTSKPAWVSARTQSAACESESRSVLPLSKVRLPCLQRTRKILVYTNSNRIARGRSVQRGVQGRSLAAVPCRHSMAPLVSQTLLADPHSS